MALNSLSEFMGFCNFLGFDPSKKCGYFFWPIHSVGSEYMKDNRNTYVDSVPQLWTKLGHPCSRPIWDTKRKTTQNHSHFFLGRGTQKNGDRPPKGTVSKARHPPPPPPPRLPPKNADRPSWATQRSREQSAPHLLTRGGEYGRHGSNHGRAAAAKWGGGRTGEWLGSPAIGASFLIFFFFLGGSNFRKMCFLLWFLMVFGFPN